MKCFKEFSQLLERKHSVSMESYGRFFILVHSQTQIVIYFLLFFVIIEVMPHEQCDHMMGHMTDPNMLHGYYQQGALPYGETICFSIAVLPKHTLLKVFFFILYLYSFFSQILKKYFLLGKIVQKDQNVLNVYLFSYISDIFEQFINQVAYPNILDLRLWHSHQLYTYFSIYIFHFSQKLIIKFISV